MSKKNSHFRIYRLIDAPVVLRSHTINKSINETSKQNKKDIEPIKKRLIETFTLLGKRKITPKHRIKIKELYNFL